MVTPDSCVFCDIVNGEAPAEIVREWPFAVAIVPLNPVTDGHLLVIPRHHVARADEDPNTTGDTASVAARFAGELGGDFNLIVNAGPLASMTVPHLHWHLVPRRGGDGLHLPWTGQLKS